VGVDVTVAEYLHRINPVYRKRNGRWVVGSEPRQRTFKAVEEVLLAGGAVADYRSAVALTLKAAPRHKAEIRSVWRHVRRYRDQTHNQAEQLSLPSFQQKHTLRAVPLAGPWVDVACAPISPL
jgi:hypothetical protein